MLYTRADDEKLLRALSLRDRGHTTASIARALGMNANTLGHRFHECERPVSESRVCAVEDCGAVLDRKNTHGVCRRHNHAIGLCACAQCRR